MTDLLDKRRARNAFHRAAADYDALAVLQREIGLRLRERLDLIRLQPRQILDLGAGTGVEAWHLLERYPASQVLALDFALGMLRQTRGRGRWYRRRRPLCLCADMEQLPLADASVDLLFSNLAAQWCDDPQRLFGECLRVLRPGGLLLFTSFGPDTLRELDWAWGQADSDYRHVSRFVDMHELGDLLLRLQFVDPVMDAERLTLTYADLPTLLRDVKGIGAANALRRRHRGLTGKDRFRRMRDAYLGLMEKGRLPATYEVLYGHAWAPLQRQTGEPGETRVSLEVLRRGGQRPA